jgi:hypothetical protein
MKKYFSLFLILSCFSGFLHAQEILPGISVRNSGGKIIVSWRNEYQKPVATINIQRSYDSLYYLYPRKAIKRYRGINNFHNKIPLAVGPFSRP